MNSKGKKAKVTKVSCEICNEETTLYNIGMHVKKYHQLDPDQYKIEHGLKKPKKKKAICRICNMNPCHLNSSNMVCKDQSCKDIYQRRYLDNVLNDKMQKPHSIKK
jgi:hypothetical protein